MKATFRVKGLKNSGVSQFLLACMMCVSNVAVSQKVHVVLSWNAAPETFTAPGKTFIAPSFAGSVHSEAMHFLPQYTYRTEWKSVYEPSVVLSEIAKEELPSSLKPSVEVPAKMTVDVAVYTIAGKQYAEVTCIPLLRGDGDNTISKVVSFDLELKAGANLQKGGERAATDYAENSVLSNGLWYKIAVGKTGMFKIDFNYLQSVLGINAASYPIAGMGVFGNGGGMIAEENSVARKDDLAENPMYVHDANGNGYIESGDYLLFYGQSPDVIKADAFGDFYHEKNLYSDFTYYFFTPDAGNGITAAVQASYTGSATHTAAYSDEYVFDEKELNNVLKSGSRWFGEKMSPYDDTKSVTLNMPSVVAGSSAEIRYRFIARSAVAPTAMSVAIDGSNLGSYSITTITGDYLDTYAREQSGASSRNLSSGDHTIAFTMQNDFDYNSEAYIDYVAIQYQRSLSFSTPCFSFRYLASADTGNVTAFNVAGLPSTALIWDVTDPTTAKRQSHTSGSFKLQTDYLHQFIAFNPGDVSDQPTYVEQVPNQNLHAVGFPDMIIVTPVSFLTAANELAQWHQTHDGLDARVVELSKIYNEFGNGQRDISAIRDFVKMMYVQAGTDVNKMPLYLLMYGDATYDPKERSNDDNINYIPTYESYESLEPVRTFPTDDFFACLDESEGGNPADGNDKMDLAVGRLPVRGLEEAFAINEKIYRYKKQASLGNWRTQVTFIADDQDNNSHMRDADYVCEGVRATYPRYNFDKIYLDAYRQVTTSAGERYPDVNEAILNKLFTGSLIMNYSGHGGITNWALERIFGQEDIAGLKNIDKLSCFVTATCDFAPFDQHSGSSAGEDLILNPNGGAIANITTTRVVFSSQNKALDLAFFNHVFEPYNGRVPTIGEVLMNTKNAISSDANNRKFVLLGDPALTLNYPTYDVVTTEINGNPVGGAASDTFKALSVVHIKGRVLDESGNLYSTFNGVVYPTIYDKIKTYTTLGNDADSPADNFDLQNSVVYKGLAAVVNGEFEFDFVVPRDINYSFGTGKISYYAHNNNLDAAGYDYSPYVGGSASSFPPDDAGPEVQVFMNNDAFRFGGITDANPVLFVKLNDDHGINVSGSGVGHDLTAVIDDDQNEIVLNDYYESALGDYTHGTVHYPLYNLAQGRHSVRVTAWDTYNNSGEGYTEFVVADNEELAITELLCYPNPMYESTTFSFAYNRCCEDMEVNIDIYDANGTKVKTIFTTLTAEANSGYSYNGINWDGNSDSGAELQKGVYVFSVRIRYPSDGAMASEFEKLVLLK